MAIPLTNNAARFGANPSQLSATGLYSKISKSMLSQNAGVQKLSAQLSRDQTRLSGLGQLQSALSDFQALSQSLSGVGLQTGATSSAPAVLSAVTNASARAGSYSIQVDQLAQAQVLASRAVKSLDSAIGEGGATTIRIEYGTQSGAAFKPGSAVKTISIDSGNNNLQGIAAALKAAGVDAAIVKGSAGYSLQLSGTSGSAGSMRVSVGGDADIQKLLAYNPGGAKGLSETVAGQDAQLTVDGKRITSSDNVVTGAIAGTALALSGKGSTQVVVAQDSAAIAKNVGNFVEGFNKLSAKLRAGAGDPATAAVFKQAQEQLSSLLGGSGASKLAAAGISAGDNGSLKLDTAKLQAALASDPAAVSRLFTDGGRGLADQMGSQIGQLIGANGSVGKETLAVSREIATVSSQKTKLTSAVTAQAQALVARYTEVSQGGGYNALTGLPEGRPMSLFDFMA